MSVTVAMLVLLAACLHATWNVIVKGGSNKLYESAINALGGGLGALCILPFLPLPRPEAIGFLALSSLFHLLYYLGITAAYRVADLSLCYPVMRGTAPIMTAIALLLLGVPLAATGIWGIALLCAGIFSLALEQKFVRKASTRGIFLALRTSLCIMCYTLSDGYGARANGDAVVYTCWIFLINIFPLHLHVLARHGKDYLDYLRGRWKAGIFGGLAGLGSYGIAIWAMSIAPIALVAALRETSVIFAMILAVLFLGERLSLPRIAAIVLVMAGAALVRLG